MNVCGACAGGSRLPSKDLKSQDLRLYSHQSLRPEDEEVTQTLDRSDAGIKADVIDELRWVAGVDRARIGVAVYEGAVILAGEVGTLPEQLLACAAQRVTGVAAVAD